MTENGRLRYLPHLCMIVALIPIWGVVLADRTSIPELATFYMLNEGPDRPGLVDAYFNLGGGWYRPTSFFAYFRVLAPIVGWNNLSGWLVVNLVLFTATVLASMRLSSRLFPASAATSALAAVLIATQPVFYIVLYEGFGFDFIYQLVTLGLVFFFVSPEPDAAMLRRWRHLLAVGAVLVLFLVGITSKEQALAVPAILLSVVFVDLLVSPDRSERLRRLARGWQGVSVLVVVLVSLAYLLLHFARMPARTGGYRTSLDVDVVASNVWLEIQWLIRLPMTTVHNFSDVHLSSLNQALGMIVVLHVGAYLSLVLGRRDRDELRPILILIAAAAASSVIPAVAGGSPWHFGLPAVFVSIVLARVFSFTFSQLAGAAARYRWAVVVSLAAVLGVMAARALAAERDGPRGMISHMLEAGLRQIPDLVGTTPGGDPIVVLDAGTSGVNRWAFGDGNIARFALKRPTLKSVMASEIETLTLEDLGAGLLDGRLIPLAFNPTSMTWARRPEFVAEVALPTVNRLASRALGEKKAPAIAGLLSSLSERFPQDGLLAYHAAVSLSWSGKLEQSAQYFSRSAVLNPGFFLSLYNQGHVLDQLHRDGEACQVFRQAANSDPKQAQTFSLEKRLALCR